MSNLHLKAQNCPNCQAELPQESKFCPQCGQKNADYRASLRELMHDLVGSLFNLDSQFFRTLPSFLLRPGELTWAFVRGKRQQYVHPVRLYLACSLLFFFFFTKIQMPIWEETIKKANRVVLEKETEIDSLFKNIPKEAQIEFSQEFSDSLSQILDTKGKEKTILLDSNQKEIAKLVLDSLKKQQEAAKKGQKFVLNLFDESQIEGEMSKVLYWIQQPSYTAEQLLDSLQVNPKERTPLLRLTAAQVLKIGRNDLTIFLTESINNVPLLTIFALPFLAMLLKILYIRQRYFFIEHLIFVLHLQSIVYVMLMFIVWGAAFSLASAIAVMMFFAFGIYVFLAFQKVYHQHWFKTFIKAHLWFIGYTWVVSILFLVDILYSFYTF